MNKRTKETAARGGAGSNLGESAARICEGLNLIASEVMRRMAPPAEVRQHFHKARIEILKGLRAMMDARIAQIEKKSSRRKGQKIELD